MAETAGPPLRGNLEQVTRTRIAGWAADPAAPGTAVTLELLIDGTAVGRFPAGLYRADLEAAGIGDGRHGFQIAIPGGLAPAQDHVVQVRHASDGRELARSPATLAAEPATTANDALAAAVDAGITADPGPRAALITALAEQAAALLFAQGSAMPEPASARLARLDLAAVPQPGPDGRPLALLIDEGTPAAGRDAGSSAALSHIRALQRLGFRVHFVSAYAIEPMGERTAALAAEGVTCWHAPWIGSVEEVLRRLGARLQLVYIHRFGVVQRYGALVRRWCPQARLVYCVADLHHLRMARQVAAEAGEPVDHPLGRAAAAGLRTAELLAILGADAVLTHSSFELALLQREVPDATVHLVPWDVPVVALASPITSRRGVAFVGSYGHVPNRDAAHVLLEEVMPRVWETAPDIRLTLAGSEMPASLHDAAAKAPAGRVEALGWVPALGTIFDRVRLTVAPLRFGAGLKGKVLDSLAAGLPCICSPMAAEGMDLPAELQGLVGTDAAEMATRIVELHADDVACTALSAAGQAWVAAALSCERIDALLRPAAFGAAAQSS